ncbi:MAG: LexA family protein [Flavisolibacter sp.]|jgi:DNA polymerase V
MSADPFQHLPLVQAGFPSPANDYLEPDLDFNGYFKQHPSATFAMRVSGESMVDAFIPHGSMVIIDRAVRPLNNSIVVATLDGERMIKHLVRTRDGIFLLPANAKFKSIRIEEGMDFSVWGTVTHAVIDVFKPRI